VNGCRIGIRALQEGAVRMEFLRKDSIRVKFAGFCEEETDATSCSLGCGAAAGSV
jgi:hypothetical protein